MKCVLLCNGELPDNEKFWKQVKEADLFICADGGANSAKKLGIEPDVIIGDYDSVLQSTLDAFSNSKLVKIEEQNSTDFEKALDYLLKQNATHVDIWGASGHRIDHTFGNLSSLVRYSRQMKAFFHSNNSTTFLLPYDFEKKYKLGQTISLLPVPKADFIVTKGLKWELNSESLELGKRVGTLNQVSEELVKIYYQSGNLFLMEVWE